MRKIMSALIVCIGLVSADFAAAAVNSREEALDLSSHQRMLSQRMFKNYVLWGLGVRSRKAKEELKTSSELFNKGLSELSLYIVTVPEARGTVEQLEQAWRRLNSRFAVEPNTTNIESVFQMAEEVTWLTSQLVERLQPETLSEQQELAEVASQQRLASQQITALYALKAWGFESLAQEPYIKALDAFNQRHQRLLSSKSSGEILGILKRVSRQYHKIEIAHEQTLSTKTFTPSLVVRASEEIVMKMDIVKGLYTNLQ